MHGEGVFSWSDGKSYKGYCLIIFIVSRSFKEDKFDGYGVFVWPNGVVYKGYWANGEMNGTGSLITDKGETYNGTWKNG